MLGFFKRKNKYMTVEAYFFKDTKESKNGVKLYHEKEEDTYYANLGGNKVEITNNDYVVLRDDGKFYPIPQDEFFNIYDVFSAEDNVFKRRVNGVIAYDPDLTEKDELGNRLFYVYGNDRYCIVGRKLVKVNDNFMICKNVIGRLYTIRKQVFEQYYEK